MKNEDRHLDLSAKFIEMGQSLMLEGKNSKDLMVSQAGGILVMLGSLMYDEKDINFFSQISSMFSAKKIVENMERNNNDFTNYLKDKSKTETYDDFIKRINDLRRKNGLEPLEE
jgi:hypothetical protein